MPLHKGAKPGSKKFGENIATEIRAGKDPKQAEAIAYSEARRDKNTRDGYGTVVATVGKYKIYEGKGRYDGFFVLAGGGEVDNFKTKAQALAEARKRTGDRLRVSKDAKGAVHVFLPNSVNYRGLGRTLARGFADRKPRRRAKDMPKENFAELKRLLVEFLGEEENEPEHAKDAGGCGCAKDCSCGCNAKDASPKKDCSCGCKH